MQIEDEEVFIPPMERPKGWKSIEQKRREYKERNKERIREYNKEYRKKNKLRLQKVRHQHYIKTMKRVKQDRMLRYQNDSEWREQVKAYNRERQRRLKLERLTQSNNEKEVN